MKFLLLRPQAKCQTSSEAFAVMGIPAVAMGLIATEAEPEALAQLDKNISQLAPGTKVVVTSTVAADLVTQHAHCWPEPIHMFAVGPSSANILQAHGVDVQVPKQASSEGLLALEELAKVQGQNVVVIKGQGGRETLVEQLQDRGGKVTCWNLYRRVKLEQPRSTEHWKQEDIHCIIATSGELIAEAFNHLDNDWLKTIPWIVVSQRTAEIAATLGVQRTLISRDASDEALIKRAKQFIENAEHFLEH